MQSDCILRRWKDLGLPPEKTGGSLTSDHAQAISRVLQLPPMESLRKCVSFDERNGTYCRLFASAITVYSRNAPLFQPPEAKPCEQESNKKGLRFVVSARLW